MAAPATATDAAAAPGALGVHTLTEPPAKEKTVTGIVISCDNRRAGEAANACCQPSGVDQFANTS